MLELAGEHAGEVDTRHGPKSERILRKVILLSFLTQGKRENPRNIHNSVFYMEILRNVY